MFLLAELIASIRDGFSAAKACIAASQKRVS